MTATKRSEAATGTGNDLNTLQATGKGTTFSERQAIKHLKELYLQRQRWKHPTLPFCSCPDFSASKTNGLTKCVLTFLKLKGHWCERSGSEGRIIDKRETVSDCLGNLRIIGSIQRVRSSGTPGTSDLKASINGKFIAIEIKSATTNDRIRPAQLEYKKHVEASGATYLIVTSFAMFINWYYSNYGEV